MLTTVNTVQGLQAALSLAQSGDTVQLATGTYDAFALKNLSFSGAGVTVTSQNPGAPAVLTGFSLSNVNGLTLQNIEMLVDPTKDANAYQINSSNQITLDHLNVHGTLNSDAGDDKNGLLIRDSNNITVQNTDFHQLSKGMAVSNSNSVTVTGNHFYEIRSDGFDGAGSSNVVVSKNYFSDFSPAPGDHPDAIQFWTTGTTASAHDIAISGNVIMRGAGGSMQGIFFRDQVGNIPFQNVQISDNLVVGSMTNGIGVSGIDHGTVSNNVVASFADLRSGITVGRATNIDLINNQSTQYPIVDSTNITETGDKVIGAVTDGGKQLLATWNALHPDQAAAATKAILDGVADRAVSMIETLRQQMVTIKGTDGNDQLSPNSAHDSIILAGAGNDTLYGGGIGHDTLIGGAGNDTYYVMSDTDVVVEDSNAGTDLIWTGLDSYTMPDNVESLRMNGVGQYVVGNALDNKITGSTGADQVFGESGNDEVHGGDGDDLISGGVGNDYLVGDNGNDTLTGDDGNDTVTGGAGADNIMGGAGNDSLTGGAAGGDTLTETGTDTLSGGNGDDTLAGATANKNYLRGDDGNDSIAGGANFDDINGNAGNDTAHGNAGDDWVIGGKGDDALFGDAGDDIVWGNLGNDTLNGGDGSDQIRGGQGDDSLSGGAGNDFLSGDRGNDTLSGGAGADTFHGSQDAGIDKILDFHISEGDRVQLDPGTTYALSQLGADTVIDMGGGNQMILANVQLASLTPGWIFLG